MFRLASAAPPAKAVAFAAFAGSVDAPDLVHVFVPVVVSLLLAVAPFASDSYAFVVHVHLVHPVATVPVNIVMHSGQHLESDTSVSLVLGAATAANAVAIPAPHVSPMVPLNSE